MTLCGSLSVACSHKQTSCCQPASQLLVKPASSSGEPCSVAFCHWDQAQLPRLQLSLRRNRWTRSGLGRTIYRIAFRYLWAFRFWEGNSAS